MYRLLLPIIILSAIVHPGVQLEAGALVAYESRIIPGGWVKYSVDWYAIERTPGVYDWSVLDTQLMALSSDHRLLLSVRQAPAWHRLDASRQCSDVLPASYDDYYAFVAAVIDRYGPQAVEVWNEPDATLSGNPELYGCWTSPHGYAALAAYTCTHMEQDYPGVISLAGALSGIDEFAEVLVPGVCDVISFHAYPAPASAPEFASVSNRIAALHALGHERLWLSETAVPSSGTDEDNTAQAIYLQYLMDDPGIEAFFWYTLGGNGWAGTDMIRGGQAMPVFDEYSRYFYLPERTRAGR